MVLTPGYLFTFFINDLYPVYTTVVKRQYYDQNVHFLHSLLRNKTILSTKYNFYILLQKT